MTDPGRTETATQPASGVSVIVTVRDDQEGVSTLLAALAEQTRMPDEIVVVDGGSRDGTLAELARWNVPEVPLRVISAPGSNIAAGRNIAVRSASYDWIACTDAGCRPAPGWLAALANARHHADLVAGTFEVECHNAFDRAVSCTHYPRVDEVNSRNRMVALSHRLFGRDFRANHAGGRSMAFSRATWEAAGGFPEHVYAGEDLAFSANALALGVRPALVEEALVLWRPRSTWSDTARMFAIYTRGDVRTRGRTRHVARVAAWSGCALVASRGRRGSRWLVGSAALAYVWLPFHRAQRTALPLREWWRIPVLVAVKDVAQMVGTFLGLVDAARGVPQPNPHSSSR